MIDLSTFRISPGVAIKSVGRVTNPLISFPAASNTGLRTISTVTVLPSFSKITNKSSITFPSAFIRSNVAVRDSGKKGSTSSTVKRTPLLPTERDAGPADRPCFSRASWPSLNTLGVPAGAAWAVLAVPRLILGTEIYPRPMPAPLATGTTTVTTSSAADPMKNAKDALLGLAFQSWYESTVPRPGTI